MIFRVQRSGNGDLDTELLNNQDGGRRRKVGLEGFTRGHAFTEMVCLARFLKPTLARPLVNLRRPQTNADGRRPQQCISHLLLGTAFHGKAARISYALIVSAMLLSSQLSVKSSFRFCQPSTLQGAVAIAL